MLFVANWLVGRLPDGLRHALLAKLFTFSSKIIAILTFFFLAAMVSGTNITLPSSGMVVVGGSGGASTTTVYPPTAGQTVTEVHAGEAPGVHWQVQGTSDVSEFLRRMNAERMHLEQQVGRDEETAVHKLLKEQVRLRNREQI